MYSDDETLPISGLQHLAFCPRQCALIHLERIWSENFLTASGRVAHERTHSTVAETRGPVRTVRGLVLRSRRLGLYGVADVVEFRREDAEPTPDESTPDESTSDETSEDESTSEAAASQNGLPAFVKLPNRRGLWRPYPVEYKRGKPKSHNADAVQLCAQALCLEEALGCSIREGALFYGRERRRTVVRIDAELRAETERLAAEFHRLIDSRTTPPAEPGPRCKACSLVDDCLPSTKSNAAAYWRESIESIERDCE